MKKSLILIFFFTTGCMQSSLLYIRHQNPQPLFTVKQILGESGLIFDEKNTSQPILLDQTNLPTVEIKAPEQRSLLVETKILETSPGSTINIQVDTQNRYVASIFYSSAGLIYMKDNSIPLQGRFVFQVGDKTGEVRIRLYQKDGTLLKEERWFIEVRPS
ncbi:MAG: hypothetical protein ACRC9L_00365 [Brevinema sp.]